MSYSVQPYLINLGELSTAMGSKDAALLQVIISKHSDKSGDESEGGCVSLHGALTHLIMGEPMDEESAHQYGYALELLCRHFGTAGGSWDGGYRGPFVKSGLDKLFMRNGPPVPLSPIDDFPEIGHVKPEAVANVLKRVQELLASSPEDEFQIVLNDLEELLKEAAQQKKTLVLFNY